MEENIPKKRGKVLKWIGIVFGVLVLLAIIGAASSKSSSSPTFTSSQSICDSDPAALKRETFVPDYKQLVKDPTASQGTIATFTGQIVQIQQSGNEGIMRLSVTKESYGWSLSDIVYVTYHQSTTAVQGDVVSVTGILSGTETYTSQANFQITIPSIDVCTVDTQPATQPAPPAQTTTPKPKATAPASTPSTSSQPSQQTYTTPSGAVINGNGTVVTPPPAPPASWHTVQTFSGQTQKNTSPFTIKGSQWRITWQETGDGYFGANTESPDGGGYCSIANLVGPGSDSTYCYTPGTYYVSVNTANSWSMTVEDYY
jgi:hypothetical protein